MSPLQLKIYNFVSYELRKLEFNFHVLHLTEHGCVCQQATSRTFYFTIFRFFFCQTSGPFNQKYGIYSWSGPSLLSIKKYRYIKGQERSEIPGDHLKQRLKRDTHNGDQCEHRVCVPFYRPHTIQNIITKIIRDCLRTFSLRYSIRKM